MSSSANTEIVKLLKNVSKDVEEIKVNIASMVGTENKVDDMFKILNAKLDLFKNLDLESRENITNKTSEKRPTKPSFFKKIFTEEREKYMNSLYTQDEIDEVFKNEEVVKKKKPEEKITKAAALLYLHHIKANKPEGRASAFESIYSDYYPS